MRYILVLFVVLSSGFSTMMAQTKWQKSLANQRHGIVLQSSTVLAGSRISFRPGLGLGYTYFGNNFNAKSILAYSQWSKSHPDFEANEFRLSTRYEYERYLNNWFSVSTFLTSDFRFSEDFYGGNDNRNDDEVTYAVGLGLSPKIYHLTEKYYFSLGIDLPLIETGYFQEDGRDPDLSDFTTFRDGAGIKFFHKEVRAVATVGYRF